MKPLPAIYKGDRTVQLSEDPDLSVNTPVFVVILENDDEASMRHQLQIMTETAFAKLWDEEGDEVWNEYL